MTAKQEKIWNIARKTGKKAFRIIYIFSVCLLCFQIHQRLLVRTPHFKNRIVYRERSNNVLSVRSFLQPDVVWTTCTCFLKQDHFPFLCTRSKCSWRCPKLFSSFGHNKLNPHDSFFACLIRAIIILIALLSFNLSPAAALSFAQPCWISVRLRVEDVKRESLGRGRVLGLVLEPNTVREL